MRTLSGVLNQLLLGMYLLQGDRPFWKGGKCSNWTQKMRPWSNLTKCSRLDSHDDRFERRDRYSGRFSERERLVHSVNSIVLPFLGHTYHGLLIASPWRHTEWHTYRVSFGHVKLVTWGLWRPGGPTRHWAPTWTYCWSQKLWKHFVKVSKGSLWSYLKFPPNCSLHFGLKKVAKATKAAFYFFG